MPAKRAIIYMRLSGSEQEDGYSYDFQEKDCRKWSREHNYEVVEVFQEQHTGSELDERKELTKVRDIIYRREFDVLLIWKFDRLARDQQHQAVILYEAQRYGIMVESPCEVLEDTPLGRFMRQALAFGAELERENAKVRSARGKLERVTQGAPLVGNAAPYGYSWVDDNKTRLSVVLSLAVHIVRIFTDVAKGVSLSSLCSLLTDEGVPTPGGGTRWHRSTITYILNNPIYWGEPMAYRVRYAKVRKQDPLTGKTRLYNQRQWVTNPTPLPANVAPAIVSKELAARAREQVARNRRQQIRSPLTTDTFLLHGGFIVCGYCGRMLTGERMWDGKVFRYYYRCYGKYRDKNSTCPSARIGSTQAEAFIWEKVESVLCDPSQVETELRRIEAHAELPNSRVATHEAHLNDIAKMREKAARSILRLNDAEDSAPLEHQLRELAKEEAAVRKALVEAENETTKWCEVHERMQQLSSWCQQHKNTETLSMEEKRRILYALNYVLIVWKPNHEPPAQVQTRPLADSGFRQPRHPGLEPAHEE